MKSYSNVMIRVIYIWILYIIYKYCLDTFVFGISFTAKLIFISMFVVAYIFDLLDFTEQKFPILVCTTIIENGIEAVNIYHQFVLQLQ